MRLRRISRETGQAMLRAVLAVMVLTVASCGACGGGGQPGANPPPVELPEFDAERAFADIEAQVAFGPRVPGSEAHAAQLAWMKARLEPLAGEVREQRFTSETVFGGPYDFTNLIAVFGAGLSGPITMLGAHWDCRPVADEDPDPARRTEPVPGANDGASGVSVLLELARLFREQPPPHPVYLAFFDAEDSGKSGSGLLYSGFCLGSSYLAQNWPADLIKPDRVIVVDLVGGVAKPNPRTPARADLGATEYFDLPMEGYSFQRAPELVNQVWTIAERLGHGAFRRAVGRSVVDDHLPFQAMGIPAINIIHYVPPVWHTTDDLPEYCSPAALRQVGETLVGFLYGM